MKNVYGTKNYRNTGFVSGMYSSKPVGGNAVKKDSVYVVGSDKAAYKKTGEKRT